MLRLVYSNRTEELLAELAARVRAQQARDGALTPVRIVVPSAAVEGYVRLGIAREQGIAANLDVALLTRFAGAVAAPAGARVADAGSLEAMALELLLDDALVSEPVLAPVRAYLRAAGDEADAVDVRRVQLAARLGRTFEEYTYSRGDMLSAWATGPAMDDAHADVEGWQRRLWLAMFAEGGLARRRAPRIVPLHEAVRTLAAAPAGTIHVFGFAHVARTFHELFERVGKGGEIVVYAPSPCEGFWEDVDRGDPTLLQLWGRPGRENVRSLNAGAGFDHDDRFVDPLSDGPRSLLRQVQSDVLRREPARETPLSPPLADDGSIVVLEHASIRRECEAVASAIWQALRRDDSLRFDGIAVLVPTGDAAAYGAHLAAAFREAHDIPYQAVGLPPLAPSRVSEAIDLLLALPLGRFTRPELLRLLVHPSVIATTDGADPERWIAWCDALGIVHGADHADHAATYIDRDILNWDQGLRRLALGAFMTGDASGDGAPVRMGDQAYVPLEVAGSELGDAATFGVLVRSLVADARFARGATMTPREWAAFLSAMVEAYVAPTGDAEADELSRRLRQVNAVGDVDLGGHRVGYRVACELARARLSAGGGGATGEGVVISTIAAVRALPFRVIFACGMGEGHFPSPDAEDPLDLRWAQRLPGDVTARERDKYAFLELVLGARDRLVLSYVSRDPLTGDAVPASSVVQELLHVVERGYVRPVSSLRRRHPLRRWDPRYDDPASGLGAMELPEARTEGRTLALRRSMERHGTRVPASEVIARAEAGGAEWAGLAQHLRLAPLPPAPPATDGRVVVPMHALVKFLELPLQGWARFRLGLDEAEVDEPLALESEPFETAPRDETLLLREVLLDAAGRGVPLEAAYDASVRGRELRGLGPSGVFARGERADHLRALEDWRRELASADVPIDSLQVHRFGRGGEHSRAHEVHDPVTVDVDVVDASGVMRVVRAEVSGRTLPVGGAPRGSVVLSKRANEGGDEWAVAGRKRTLLRAFVDYAVLAAAGAESAERHRGLVVVATRERPIVERLTFRPLSADAARVWLRDLLRELLGAPHAYFFPCEAVFVHHARDPRAPLFPVLEEARDRMGTGDGPPALRSAYGPVPRPQEYPLPGEAAASAMVARRFGPLLQTGEEES